MLHIERRPDIDAGIEQLLHILPALGMARAGRIAVGQLVEQQHLWVARQRRIQVKGLALAALVGQQAAGQQLQAVELLHGLGPAMGLHQAHQHLAARLALALRSGQHCIGLAHPGIGAKVDAQLAPGRLLLVGLELGDQRVRVRPGGRCAGGIAGVGHGGAIVGQALRTSLLPSAACRSA